MAQLIVDANATNITIDSKEVDPNIGSLLATFKTLCDNAGVPIDDIGSFELLNANINRADSIKDGTNTMTLDSLKLFTGATWTLPDLKNIIHRVKDHCIHNNLIQRFTFTRTKADGNNNSRSWELGPDFRIGYDAGLGLDTLFPGVDHRSILIETFGKYIDPSTGGRDAGGVFPNTTLSLTEKLFNTFGYSGNASCRLNAERKKPDTYEYQMLLAKHIITNSGTGRVGDKNITKFFGGNASKKVLLGDGDASNKTLLKKQVIVGKGLGDKLQVIILWIRSQMPKGRNTGIATCDEVVALLCIILQLTFFLTSTSRDDNNVKIDEVLFYNPRGQDAGAALKRYEIEYAIVMTSYTVMIELIERLSGDSAIPVIASGGGTDVLQIPYEFYNAMITDLRTINVWIDVAYNSRNFHIDASASTIYSEMSQLKKLTARQIFKLNKNESICQFVRTAKTYTCDDSIVHYPFDKHYLKKGDTDIDISRRTFYELFTKIPTMGGGGMLEMIQKYKMGISIRNTSDDSKNNGDPYYMDGIINQNIQINIDRDPYKQSNFVYIDPIFAWIKPGDPIEIDVEGADIDELLAYENPKNCDPGGRFDANAALRIKLYKLYSDSKSVWGDVTFWEVLNESMEVFVYDPRYQTTRLKELMDNFNKGGLYLDETESADSEPSGIRPRSGSSDRPPEEVDTSQFIPSHAPWSLGENREPSYVAWILNEWREWKNRHETPIPYVPMTLVKGEEAGSGSPVATMPAVVGNPFTPDATQRVSSAPNVTPADAAATATAADAATGEQLNMDAVTGSDPDVNGGSRRSTRRRKYRKTLKTTRRKKTRKQSSRTTRSKRRRINKKRRSTTRKN